MAAMFIYACWDALWRSRWLTGAAALLNLLFIVGFPLAFIGRVAGGMPAFVYGVPPLARLLLIPPVTTLLTLAAAVVAIRGSRSARAPVSELVRHWLVVTALMSFVAFAAWWHVLDGGF